MMVEFNKPWRCGSVALVAAGMLAAACQAAHPAPAAPMPDVASTRTRCTDGALACVTRAGTLVVGGRRDQAIALLRQVCIIDDEPLGCSALARTLLAERAPDLQAVAEVGERALAGWGRRCEAEDWAACVYLGKDIDALVHDAASAFAAFDLACAHDQGDGCAEAGTYAQDGAGTPRDRDGAILRYIRGCQLGSATGCFYLGLVLQDGQGADVQLDEGRAVASFAAACELGDLRGCNNRALALQDGRGVAKDEAGALPLFVTACDAGHGNACQNAAVAFEHGTGVAVDERAASAYYGRACERGTGEACRHRGYRLEVGIGVDVDLAAAHRAYVRACELNWARGCFDAGRFYINGKAGPADDILGARYLSQACTMKDAEGCRETGFAYLVGRGLVRDETKAVAAFLVACDLGDMESCGQAGATLWRVDPARAPEPLARHCTSEMTTFRESCGLLVVLYVQGTVSDPAAVLPFAERACLASPVPDERLEPGDVVRNCEGASHVLDALPPARAEKARRARLVETLAAARAASPRVPAEGP